MQKKKSYLPRVTLDAAEHKVDATGRDVSMTGVLRTVVRESKKNAYIDENFRI